MEIRLTLAGGMGQYERTGGPQWVGARSERGDKNRSGSSGNGIEAMMSERKFRWWHGVVFYAGVQAAQWGMRLAVRKLREQESGAPRSSDRETYRAQWLPKFAPPAAAFPIAWSINSLSTIAGGLYALNLPKKTPGRRLFLGSQLAAWVLFALFSTAYFELESPINAAAVTLAYTGVTGLSLQAAWCRMHDKRAAASLLTTLAWLALANPLGLTQAAWNYDPFWKAGPFLEPPADWVR
jgi:tryptophan-rich sensory protein